MQAPRLSGYMRNNSIISNGSGSAHDDEDEESELDDDDDDNVTDSGILLSLLCFLN